MTAAEAKRSALRAKVLDVLARWPGTTATIVGQELWGVEAVNAQPANRARFARQAGKVLNAMLADGLVRRAEPDKYSRIWYVMPGAKVSQ